MSFDSVVASNPAQATVLEAIVRERDRQDVLWGTDRLMTIADWTLIIGEEWGEFSQEANKVHWGHTDRLEALKTELIQQIAGAVAFLEALHTVGYVPRTFDAKLALGVNYA